MSPLTRIVLFLAFLSVSFSSTADSIYFGFAGYTPGSGSFGHAFLAIEPEDRTIHDSVIYSFSISSFRPNQRLSFEEILRGNVRFRLNVREFAEYTYTNQIFYDRMLRVVELNMTNKEINQLEELLVRYVGKELHELEAYNYLTNNCITFPLKLINKVVTAERQVTLGLTEEWWRWDGYSTIPFKFVDGLLNRAPYHLDRIFAAGHPLSKKGKVRIFHSLSTKRVKLIGAIFRHLHTLVRECELADSTRRALKAYITFSLKEESVVIEKSQFEELTAHCDRSESLDKMFQIMKYLDMFFDDESGGR